MCKLHVLQSWLKLNGLSVTFLQVATKIACRVDENAHSKWQQVSVKITTGAGGGESLVNESPVVICSGKKYTVKSCAQTNILKSKASIEVIGRLLRSIFRWGPLHQQLRPIWLGTLLSTSRRGWKQITRALCHSVTLQCRAVCTTAWHRTDTFE